MLNGDGPVKLGSAPGGVLANVWSLVDAPWRHARQWRAGVLLIAICLTVYVPGLLQSPPIDRDESRFAQASRQMFESVSLAPDRQTPALHSGGVIIPMVQDKPRLNKPPLIYWLQAASAWLFTGGDPSRDAIWMYRVPSLLCAIGAVLVTWRLGLRMFDPRAAWLGAALLAVCPLVAFDAHQARADQLLLFSVVLTQAALWRVWRERAPSWTHAALLWLAISMGIMAKGPIAPMIDVLTLLSCALVTGSWRVLARVRPLLGIIIVAVCVGPWLYAVGERVGWSSYWSLVVDETLGRSVEAKEGHWGPPGYHTLLLAALFWPGSLATLAAMGRAIRVGVPRASAESRWKRRAGRAGEIFCLAWLVPSWLVFEAVGTKLPHYTMPLYPAIALLSARGLLSLASRLDGKARASMPEPRRDRTWFDISSFSRPITWLPWAILGCCVAVGAPALLWFLRADWRVIVAAAVLPVGACMLLVAACRAARASKPLRAQGLGVSGAMLALVTFFLFALPCATALSPLLIEQVREIDPSGARPLACSGYQEDSLVFLTRATVLRVSEDSIAEWATHHPDAVIIAPDASKPSGASLFAAGWRARAILEGLNLGRGRMQRVAVWTRGEP